MDSAIVNTSHSGPAPMPSGANLSFNQFLAASSPPIYKDREPGTGQECANETWNLDLSDSGPSSWPCVLVEPTNRKRRWAEHRRIAPFPPALTYSATYNENGHGYNVTLPGHLCANTLVGDYRSPAGNLYHNASIATVHNSLAHLPRLATQAFTIRSLVLARDELYDALKPFICDPPASGARALLFRYDASSRSGECCYALLAVGGTIVLFVGSMYVPFVHPGRTADWSGLPNLGLAVAGIALMASYNVMLDRLRRSELGFQTLEADTLNLFLAPGDGLMKSLRAVRDGTCWTAAVLWSYGQEFCTNSCLPGLRGPLRGLGAGDGGQAPGDLGEVVVQDVCEAP